MEKTDNLKNDPPLFPFHNSIIIILFCFAVIFCLPFFLLLFRAQKTYVTNHYHKERLIIPPHAKYVPHRLMIKFKDGESPDELRDTIKKSTFIDSLAAILTGTLDPRRALRETEAQLKQAGVIQQSQLFPKIPALHEMYILQLSQGADIAQSMNTLNHAEFIDYANPQYIATTQAIPAAQYYPTQWDMKKIDMEDAWNLTTGSHDVVVAVVDSGVDVAHPDLAGNITKIGNFSGEDNNDDGMGHGTHVAGTIGARGNNGVGIAGINWNVSILAEKVCNHSNECDGIIQGIGDAVVHRVKVINMSLEHTGVSCEQDDSLQQTIDYAISQNIIVVAAAGNGDWQTHIGVDASTSSPASCNGVIAVGATGPDDQRPEYSNWGSKVSIAAPGGSAHQKVQTDILSTWPSTIDELCKERSGLLTGYCVDTGTSMAAPHVTGVIALLYAKYPNLSKDQITKCLFDGADPISTDKPIGGKRVNAYKALLACKNVVEKTHTAAAITNPTQDISRNSIQRLLTATPNITSSTNTPTSIPLPAGDTSRQAQGGNGAAQNQDQGNTDITSTILYDCFEVPESKTVGGQTIQVTKLQCNYKQP